MNLAYLYNLYSLYIETCFVCLQLYQSNLFWDKLIFSQLIFNKPSSINNYRYFCLLNLKFVDALKSTRYNTTRSTVIFCYCKGCDFALKRTPPPQIIGART